MKCREQLIEEYLREPIKIGDSVRIRGLGIQNKQNWGNIAEVTEIVGGGKSVV